MLQTTYQPKILGISETLLCNIISPSGRVRTVRALIDGGSQITALKKSIATEMGLQGEKRTLIVGTSGAQTLKYTNQLVTYVRIASLDGKFVTNFEVEAITMPSPTSDISAILTDPKKHKHLENIQFTEPLPMNMNTKLKVELLIGQPIVANIFKEIIVGESINQPAAAIYHIGACLTGSSSTDAEIKKSLFSSVQIQSEPTIDIGKWFSLEHLGIENPTEENQLKADEQAAEDLMNKYTHYAQMELQS